MVRTVKIFSNEAQQWVIRNLKPESALEFISFSSFQIAVPRVLGLFESGLGVVWETEHQGPQTCLQERSSLFLLYIFEFQIKLCCIYSLIKYWFRIKVFCSAQKEGRKERDRRKRKERRRKEGEKEERKDERKKFENHQSNLLYGLKAWDPSIEQDWVGSYRKLLPAPLEPHSASFHVAVKDKRGEG